MTYEEKLRRDLARVLKRLERQGKVTQGKGR